MHNFLVNCGRKCLHPKVKRNQIWLKKIHLCSSTHLLTCLNWASFYFNVPTNFMFIPLIGNECFIRIHKFRLLGQGEGLSQDRTSFFPSPVWLSGTAWALSARWCARQTSPATPTFGSLTWRSSTKRLARGRSSVLGLPLNLEVWISRLFLRVATFSWCSALSGSSRKGSSLPAVYTSTRSHWLSSTSTRSHTWSSSRMLPKSVLSCRQFYRQGNGQYHEWGRR